MSSLGDTRKETVAVKESLDTKIKKYLGSSLSPTSSTILGHSLSPTSSNLLLKSGISLTKLDMKRSVQSTSISSETKKKVEVKEDKSLLAIEQKLPPNWKCKRNDKGLIYYYNLKTKVSQWEYPGNKSNLPIINEAVNEESPSTTNSNSESFKLLKDQFREKLSKVVVNILKPYLNEKTKFGHIKNSDDFKHLARKFTHTILEKEISRVTKLEALEIDNRIKIKSQEYITTYMSKFNTSGYCRKQDI
jgi:hypothetical protein